MSSIDDLRRKFSVDAPPVEPEPIPEPDLLTSPLVEEKAFKPCSDKGCIGPDGHLGEHLHDPKAEFDPATYKLVVGRMALEQCPGCGEPRRHMVDDSDGTEVTLTCRACSFAYALDDPVMLIARNVKTDHDLNALFEASPKAVGRAAAVVKAKERRRVTDAVKYAGASSKARWALSDDADGDEDGILQFGQHSGSNISDLAQDTDGRSYLRWLIRDGGFPKQLVEVAKAQMDKHAPPKPPPR